MIRIHEHCRDHDQCRAPPTAAVERKRYKDGDDEVQGDMVHECRLRMLKNGLTPELSRDA